MEAPDEIQAFPYTAMLPTSIANSPASAGSTLPQTPSSSSNQRGLGSYIAPAPSKEARKEAKKEAKRIAKRAAHQQALRSGPSVGGLIFDPSANAKTTTSLATPRYSSTPRAMRSNTPSDDKLSSTAEPESKWPLMKLLDYIVEHDILLHPEDREVARNHLRDRNVMMQFLDKMEAARQGGEIPSAEEISSAEELAARDGSLLLQPLDWSKGNFMEVLGLKSNGKAVPIPNVDWEDEGSRRKGKEVMTRHVEWEDEGVPSSPTEHPDPELTSPTVAATTRVTENKVKRSQPTSCDLASGNETEMTMSEKKAFRMAIRDAFKQVTKATAKIPAKETTLEEIEEANEEVEMEPEAPPFQADNDDQMEEKEDPSEEPDNAVEDLLSMY